ncbi:MAG TPA: glycosyltransferase family 39 protein [Isosphaeraceae bacterium]|jgi:hypothetical protein|nr:glycosyltransferase family 39 protein [Isosphaeraceae bacterium]
MTERRALWILVATTALLRLFLAASLGPSNDEAYYALFAVHRDWSYFDQPPMVALVESIGMVLGDVGTSPFPLRLGFIALFAGSTLVMARLGARCYGARVGLLAALALNVTGYFSVVAGTFALPDGPLVFFWLLTLDRLSAALASPSRSSLWVGVGLAWGGALLSKYHAVFLPAGALMFLLFEPSARHWLRRPGPYLAVAIGLFCFAPVICWNATHGWASFAFQGGRALGSFAFRPAAFAATIGGQAAYLLPWIWVAALATAVRRLGRWSAGTSESDRFLLCQAVLPLLVFTALSCVRPVLPHWSLEGFLSLLPLLAQDWDRRLMTAPGRMKRRLIILATLPVVLSWVAVEETRSGFLQKGGHSTLGLITPRNDPTLDLFGWDQVARGMEQRGLIGQPDTFLFTGNWYHSGQLAFATRHAMAVLCYHSYDARGFAFWSAPSQWIGCDGILVTLDNRSVEPHCFDRWFARIEPIGEIPIIRAGVPVHRARLFRCVRQLKAFPYDRVVPPDLRRQLAKATPWARWQPDTHESGRMR